MDPHDSGAHLSSLFDRRAIPAEALESEWSARDGQRVRRIDWAGAVLSGGGRRGSLLFLPGRADFYEKYLESLDRWQRGGWRVTALDWRWQAGSGRFGADRRAGDVDDFATWIADLGAFWREWIVTTPGPHVIVGHSMGGHLVLRALAEHAIEPVAAVLSAPMLGFHTPIPDGLQPAFGQLMCLIGSPARLAWQDSEKPGSTPEGRAALLTHDAARYADEQWWRENRPQLDLGPPTWRWVLRAAQSNALMRRQGALEAVKPPVLVVAAKADQLVAWSAIERAVPRLPQGEVVSFGPEAAHELLREADPVRNKVLAAIDEFLDRVAPPGKA
ncbi:alpha/beta hydrolase [Novosphingobium sp. FKTRR1]|uniref:alpha/beta hydrolase n=1 Tax=Novosphingobium sp. FKTRR1 TaxID=2879118 RepID=UPI001CF0A0F7|nr:alpha/beta hydrolase [Novosphingobium sp. FKTRR1]